MKLSIINELLRGKWLMDQNHADKYRLIAEDFLKNPNGFDNSKIKKTGCLMAVGMDSGDMYYDDNGPDDTDDDNDGLPQEPYIGVIPISGVIMTNDYCGSIGTKTMMRMMLANDQNPLCMAQVLLMDTPGGTASGLANMVKTMRGLNKPVVAHIENMCCSAGYYIACGARKIFADQADCTVGSIGVYCTLYDDREMMKKEGVTKIEVYSSYSPEKNSAWKKALDGDTEALKTEYIDPTAEVFLKTVKDNRPNLTDKSALQGKSYAAINAPDGMIDGITTFEETLAQAASLAVGTLSHFTNEWQ